MEKINLSVPVSKDLHDVILVLTNLIDGISKAYEDGIFNPATEIIPIITGLVMDTVSAYGKIQYIPADFKESWGESSLAVFIPVITSVERLLETLAKAKKPVA